MDGNLVSTWSMLHGSTSVTNRGAVLSNDQLVEGLDSCFHMRTHWDRELLRFIAEADRRRVYESEGYESTASWLCSHLGIGYMKACLKVDIALTLESQPGLALAYEQGHLSYDHLRALVKVITPENEQELLSQTVGRSVADGWRLSRKILLVSPEDSVNTRQERFLEMRLDHESRLMMLSGMLPEDQGAVLKKAVDQLAAAMPDDPSMDFTSMATKRADALSELAAASLTKESSVPTVVVHVDAETLASGNGVAEIEHGCSISAETARRLACDANVQTVIELADGTPMDAGRLTPTIPRRLRRQLNRRDKSCRYPDCRRNTGLDAHHIVHRAEGGERSFQNLVLLCKQHHVFVHEHRYKVGGDPPNIWIERPGLPPLRTGPPPRSEAVQTHLKLGFSLRLAPYSN